MNISTKYIRALVAVSALATSLAASALSVSYTNSFAYKQPNFGTNLAIPQFDSSLGTLTSVQYTIRGQTTGDIGLENTSLISTNTITGTLGANVRLFDPLINPLLLINPSYSTNFDAPTYDGLTDYGGASGASFLGVISTVDSGAGSSSAAALLAAVTDVTFPTNDGSADWPVTVFGASSATGGGSTSSSFVTFAKGTLEVTYIYNTTVVPEASTWIAMAPLAAFGAWVVRRRFAAKA